MSPWHGNLRDEALEALVKRYTKELEKTVSDLNKVNLILPDNAGMTLLCKAIELGKVDLLTTFLAHIQDNLCRCR